jgi:hypothetical protein
MERAPHFYPDCGGRNCAIENVALIEARNEQNG